MSYPSEMCLFVKISVQENICQEHVSWRTAHQASTLRQTSISILTQKDIYSKIWRKHLMQVRWQYAIKTQWYVHKQLKHFVTNKWKIYQKWSKFWDSTVLNPPDSYRNWSTPSLVVGKFVLKTKGSWFESTHELCAEVSSLQ